MKLVLLGTTGYHPSAARHTACNMLPEIGVIFDAGSGMFRVSDYLATKHLDLFLSHAHLDHTFGLTFLLDVLLGKNMERVTIHARQKDIDAVDTHLLDESMFPVKLPYEFRPLGNDPIEVAGGGKLTWCPLEHPGGAVGYRLDFADRSMAYITDTTAESGVDYIKFIAGVDVLLHECNFDDSMGEWSVKTGHSCTTPVAEVAKEANVGKLVLVHLNPLGPAEDPIGIDAAKKVFANTELGVDLAEIEF